MSWTEEETRTGLRRRRSSGLSRGIVDETTEQLLIEKLDSFLTSVESTLERFEKYFQINKVGRKQLKDGIVDTMIRENAGTSLNSVMSFSAKNLGTMHHRLRTIKEIVLNLSFTNLDHLHSVLDSQFQYFFNQSSSDICKDVTTKEALSQKIITMVQYFDDKLGQVDELVQSRLPQGTIDYSEKPFSRLRYYKFNSSLKKAEKGHLHYYDLPLLWRENQYIVYGYRFSLKHKHLIFSIFNSLHNETVNIWSHLLGFILMFYISFWHYPHTEVFKYSSVKDNIVVYLFLLAAIKCFAASVMWHTYCGFAKYSFRSRCSCMDYTGITSLISASVFSTEYCTLYHYPFSLRVFIGFTAISGLAGLILSWSPKFDVPEARCYRVGFFVGLALLGIGSCIYMLITEGLRPMVSFFLPILYKSLVWYGIGVVFYGTLFPERWRYDVIFTNEDINENDSEPSKGDENLGGNQASSDTDEAREVKTGVNEAREEIKDSEAKAKVKKHFPLEPVKTPYDKDFFSLWWVDYFFMSHNVWHICVLFGVLGHYFVLLEMFAKVFAN